MDNQLQVPLSDTEELLLKDPYAFFMKNEPHLNLTPIEVDPDSGFRFTYRNIGMVRNAPDYEKTREKVFLDPIPHVVKEQNIPLRGWYKG